MDGAKTLIDLIPSTQNARLPVTEFEHGAVFWLRWPLLLLATNSVDNFGPTFFILNQSMRSVLLLELTVGFH
jgi:hypothetical protein